MRKIQIDENLINIITISTRLDDLYQTLLMAKIDENEEKEKETLEDIKIVTNYENELYNNLNIRTFPSQQLTNRFSYLLRKSEKINELDKELIYSRFINYINDLTIRNPFLSMKEDIVDRIEENIASIENQVQRDYAITLLFLLSEEIKKGEDSIKQCALLEEYIYTIYKQKVLEQYLTTFPTRPEKSGRERCLIFNQEKNLVNETYQRVITDYLHQDIASALNITDSTLAESPDDSAYYLTPTLLCITASNMILEQEERKNIPLEFSSEDTKNSYHSCKKVLQALSNGVYLDRTYQKRKVYNTK